MPESLEKNYEKALNGIFTIKQNKNLFSCDVVLIGFLDIGKYRLNTNMSSSTYYIL